MLIAESHYAKPESAGQKCCTCFKFAAESFEQVGRAQKSAVFAYRDVTSATIIIRCVPSWVRIFPFPLGTKF